MSAEETVDIPGGKGTANIAGKCKFCSRQYSIGKCTPLLAWSLYTLLRVPCDGQLYPTPLTSGSAILDGQNSAYNKDGDFSTIQVFEVRGTDLAEFDFRVKLVFSFCAHSRKDGWTASGSESNTSFSIDLSEKVGYCCLLTGSDLARNGMIMMKSLVNLLRSQSWMHSSSRSRHRWCQLAFQVKPKFQ